MEIRLNENTNVRSLIHAAEDKKHPLGIYLNNKISTDTIVVLRRLAAGASIETIALGLNMPRNYVKCLLDELIEDLTGEQK